MQTSGAYDFRMASGKGEASGGPSKRPLYCALAFLVLACIGLLIGVIVLATRESGGDGKENGGAGGGNGGSGGDGGGGGPVTDDGPKLSLGEYRYAAVASESYRCNNIGTRILSKGGSAVDAAIAGLLCLEVVSPHYSGIGGGFLMTIYDKSKQDTKRSIRALNAREVAPIAATQDMFINSTLSSQLGGGAVAVPGQVAGFKTAHDLYGKLPWADLFEPAIALAKESAVSGSLATWSELNEKYLREYDGLREQFIKPDNTTYKPGDVIRMEKLAATFVTIANEGPDAYYNGSLAQDIVDDIKDAGGIITLEDLGTYATVMKDGVQAKLLNETLTVYGPPPPSSAIVIAFILNIIEGYNMNMDTPADLREHRIAEAMKFAYAKRSLLGDPPFAENITEWIQTLTDPVFAATIRQKIWDNATHEDIMYYEPAFDIKTDSGTSHLSVIAPDGSAVSVTATINLHFGSKVRGNRTGIIFNNEMDDFSTPGLVNAFGVSSSPQNYIVPGKRPMSSMSPIIVVDDQGVVRANIGAAGGTRIITSITQSIINSLLLGLPIDEAVAKDRIHHQLLPNRLVVEKTMPKDVQDKLKARGHELEIPDVHRWFGACNAIVNDCPAVPCAGCDEPCMFATADWRAEEAARAGPLTDGY